MHVNGRAMYNTVLGFFPAKVTAYSAVRVRARKPYSENSFVNTAAVRVLSSLLCVYLLCEKYSTAHTTDTENIIFERFALRRFEKCTALLPFQLL